MEDKSLKALRLLEISKRLQSITAELEIEINAPIRKRKPSKRMIDKAESYAKIEEWANNLKKKSPFPPTK